MGQGTLTRRGFAKVGVAGGLAAAAALGGLASCAQPSTASSASSSASSSVDEQSASASAAAEASSSAAAEASSSAVVDDGEEEVIRSHCRACGKMECPIWVTVKNGRVVKIEGDNTAISSHGNCCSKGLDAMQALYHPDRVKYPMKRTNPKGEDPGWVRISWDEAIDLAAEGLQKIIDDPNNQGWHSIKILHGTGRTTTYGIESLPAVVGMSNVGSTAGQVCKGPRIATGSMIAYPSPHWVACTARIILCGFIDSWI